MSIDPIFITDVSPRDGLQNEPLTDAGPVSIDNKLELIRLLIDARVDEIEITSFVSPKLVPQLADAAEIVSSLGTLSPTPFSPIFSVLVPNLAGLHRLLAIPATGSRRVTKIAVFTAASETFAKRNVNATIAETIERFRPVIADAHAANLEVRGYVSCAIACPFEGAIAPAKVAEVSRSLLDIGVDEVDVADTIGAGTPESVTRMLEAVFGVVSPAAVTDLGSGNKTRTRPRLALHLHDTFGRARECIDAAVEMGVRSFDGAVGGLGGCPFASTPGNRAPGNVDTSVFVDVVRKYKLSCSISPGGLELARGHALSLRRS